MADGNFLASDDGHGYCRKTDTESLGMAGFTIDELDDETLYRLCGRALRNNRTLAAEARNVIAEALGPDPLPTWDELAAAVREHSKGRPQTPSEVLLREMRAER